jgi:Tfp pilus assembly protein PilN
MSQSPITHTIFLTLDQVVVANTHVPITFTEEDIVQYVMIEQAPLFPTLDQAIYFDFLVTSEDEETKKIAVVACNMKDFSSVASTLQFLKVSHEEFTALNLLPWRQRRKEYLKKKQRKIFFMIGVSVSVVMLIICLWFFYVAHQDEKRRHQVTAHLHQQTKKLTTLEASNDQYQQLQQVWQGYINIAQEQENLEKALIIIESQRPLGLCLQEIQWHEKTLFLTGYAPNVDAVKFYISQLQRSHLQAKLKSLKNSEKKSPVVTFEIFIERLL